MDSQLSEDLFFTMLLEGEEAHNETTPRARMKPTTKRGVNFSVEEDCLLVSAWLNTSIDSIQENEQKSHKLWERICNYYHEHKRETIIERSEHSLTNRWSAIQHGTNKFCGFLAQVKLRNPSGVSEHDKIEEAKKLYREFHKTTFQYEHCWDLLKDVPKWNLHMAQMKSKRKYIPTSSPSTLESINLTEDNVENVFVDLERPLGKKSLKEREKKRKSQDCPSSNIAEILSELKEVKKRSYKAQKKGLDMGIEARQAIVRIEKQKLDIEQKKEDREQRKEERKQRKEEIEIMMMETKDLSPTKQGYIRLLKKKIMEKRMAK